MGNNGIRVHAARHTRGIVSVETECGTVGRTRVEPDTWRTALGNQFKIGRGDEVTCVACKRWLKVKHT